MKVGLPALFLHASGTLAVAGGSIPANAILFNGVPLLFNGQNLIYT